jgi:hypothetical protein
MVKLLLENGANIESSDERGMTPLKLAARHGHEIVEVGSVSRGTLKGGYVTTYWGAQPRKAIHRSPYYTTKHLKIYPLVKMV